MFGWSDHPANPLFSTVSTQTTQPVSSFSPVQDSSFFGQAPRVDGRDSLETVHNLSQGEAGSRPLTLKTFLRYGDIVRQNRGIRDWQPQDVQP